MLNYVFSGPRAQFLQYGYCIIPVLYCSVMRLLIAAINIIVIGGILTLYGTIIIAIAMGVAAQFFKPKPQT